MRGGKGLTEYELSTQADQDISDLYDYSSAEFGSEQAISYMTELDALLLCLVENPELGRMRNEIRKGLRSFVFHSHVVFYRVMKTRIRVIRILHGSRDLPSRL